MLLEEGCSFYPRQFDVIVIGAGHAGCEAAHIAACMGMQTLLVSGDLDNIAKMSCNPSIGGTGKGQIVREIDALGGLMGKVADQTGIQFRMLNASRGAAVRSPRCQSEKRAYSMKMKEFLEQTPNLYCMQASITKLLVRDQCVYGVQSLEGIAFLSKAVIISSGTFMQGMIHISHHTFSGGRSGEKGFFTLSKQLKDLGFCLGRMKTGTSPRIHRRSIQFDQLEEQKSEENVFFSFSSQTRFLQQVSCWITYTTVETKEIVHQKLSQSSMFSGNILGSGARYCPSFEDKVVRFAHKNSHQIFLEPEGISTQEVYINGLSMSLPIDIQYQVIRTVPGLEEAEIIRPGYAIEYDYVKRGQLSPTLETRLIQGLYFAGQINGTTGYEEAAGQGLIAGINSSLKIQGKPSCDLWKARNSYLGVMICDIVMKKNPLEEPYRMFTNRVESRLTVRHDNADIRLMEEAYRIGTIPYDIYAKRKAKKEAIEQGMKKIKEIKKHIGGKRVSLAVFLSQYHIFYEDCIAHCPDEDLDYGDEVNRQIETNIKYEGYIVKMNQELRKTQLWDSVMIPRDFDFAKVANLSTESILCLTQAQVKNLGEASQLEGVTISDLFALLVSLKK